MVGEDLLVHNSGTAAPMSYRLAVANRQDGKQEFCAARNAEPVSIEQSFRAFQADGPPSSARRLDPSAVRDVIVGTWSSPVMTVTCQWPRLQRSQ